MDYKEKYEQALSRARQFSEKPLLEDSAGIVEYIFPELAESEDERIRKALIKYHTLSDNIADYKICGVPARDVIAWLEKQGKLVEDYEDRLDRCACESFNKGYKAAIEHQKEKPADKIEPKFKVGDWITNGIETIQITGYDIDYGYQVDYKGNLQHRDTDIIEKEYHLWTIDDAKHGDVLCDYHEAYDNPLIFILKKFEHVNFGLVRPSDYSSYCFLTAGDKQRFKEGTYHHKHNIKPATKEQRDLLFRKMKEASYEWDAEKKELKKIEQKPDFCHHEVDFSDCSEEYRKAYYDGWNNCNQQHSQLKAEQKPSWSEEDKGFVDLLLAIFTNEHPNGIFTTDNITVFKGNCVPSNRIITWLESLKDRVQPTLAWNENDEVALESAATNYSQGKLSRVQTAVAFMAGARWVLQR